MARSTPSVASSRPSWRTVSTPRMQFLAATACWGSSSRSARRAPSWISSSASCQARLSGGWHQAAARASASWWTSRRWWKAWTSRSTGHTTAPSPRPRAQRSWTGTRSWTSTACRRLNLTSLSTPSGTSPTSGRLSRSRVASSRAARSPSRWSVPTACPHPPKPLVPPWGSPPSGTPTQPAIGTPPWGSRVIRSARPAACRARLTCRSASTRRAAQHSLCLGASSPFSSSTTTTRSRSTSVAVARA
mmetsp:Transcript_71990/g.233964  ORF Transcript_71990/g.233964 Transcript_71990/m.233964 type:complete len:246 (-) Transcript_71990:787-1524(-)